MRSALNREHPANREQRFVSFHKKSSSAATFSLPGLAQLPVPERIQEQVDNYVVRKAEEERRAIAKAKWRTEGRQGQFARKTAATVEPIMTGENSPFSASTYEKCFRSGVGVADVGYLTQNEAFRTGRKELQDLGIQFSHPLLRQWSPENLDKRLYALKLKEHINKNEAEEAKSRICKSKKYQFLSNYNKRYEKLKTAGDGYRGFLVSSIKDRLRGTHSSLAFTRTGPICHPATQVGSPRNSGWSPRSPTMSSLSPKNSASPKSAATAQNGSCTRSSNPVPADTFSDLARISKGPRGNDGNNHPAVMSKFSTTKNKQPSPAGSGSSLKFRTNLNAGGIATTTAKQVGKYSGAVVAGRMQRPKILLEGDSPTKSPMKRTAALINMSTKFFSMRKLTAPPGYKDKIEKFYRYHPLTRRNYYRMQRVDKETDCLIDLLACRSPSSPESARIIDMFRAKHDDFRNAIFSQNRQPTQMLL